MHILPRYATDKLVMQEVVYHLSTGFLATFDEKKKAPRRTLPMQIGLYEIKNLKVADFEGRAIEKFAFNTMDFNLYDPWNACRNHHGRIHFYWLSGTFHRS